MKWLLCLFLALPASAQPVTSYSGGGPLGTAGGSLTGSYPNPTFAAVNSDFSTMTVRQNSALVNYFPNTPLLMAGNINSYFQAVLQNLSNGANASSDWVATNDLGGNTSFYINVGINSSRFSQAAFSSQSSSDGYVTTSDSSLFLWSGINGGLNGAATGQLVLGSGIPNFSDIALVIAAPSALGTPGAATFKSTVTLTNSLTFQGTGSGSTIAANGQLALSTAPSAAAATANMLINSSGQTIFTPSLSSFTVSGALSGTFAGTINSVCITGSTVTLTLPAGVTKIMTAFRGSIADGNLAAGVTLGILVNGAYVDGQTSAKGLTTAQDAVATDNMNMSFPELLTGLSAGQNNICLTGFVSAGTATIESTVSVAKFFAYMLP